MSQDLTETLAKLSDRNFPKEEADALLASLKDKNLQLEMEFQRHNTTLSISAPDAYRGGQTLNGKAGQREVQVLVPETDEQEARALTYGTSLSLVVRYLEFDDFYRRATFTGSLQDKAEKSEPVSSPEPEPEPEPEPVTEPEPVADEPVPEKVEPAEPAVEKEEGPAIIEPPSPELPKQKTGELAVFTSPNLSASGASISGKSSVRSSDLIATLAQQTQSTQEEAALVVDGFWDYLADVKGHYREHSPENHTLVIPHFGTFKFRFKWRNKRTFEFIPGPRDSGPRGIPSSSWVDQWSGEPGGLSVRRRISVFVAEQSGLPLKKADTLLNQLLDAVKGLFRKGATINWARRGTMRGITTRKGKEIYSFFPSPGFLERLQIPPAPKYYTPEPEPEQTWSHDHTEYEPEHTWEEDAPEKEPAQKKESDWTRHTEGEGPQSGSYKSSKPPMPAEQKMLMKASGCGCITLPFLAVGISSGKTFMMGILLGILFIGLLIKRGLCHKG